MTAAERQSTVRSRGADLAVFEYGPPTTAENPSLLLVHGYPDDHHVFDGAVERLAADRHVITYDTRNAGASRVDNPQDTASYRLDLLVDDLYAVVEASGAGSVHLAGHDWGSIQGWAALQDPRARERILSYTSVSGPDLGHFRTWLSSRVRTPLLWPQALNQLLRLSYTAAFQLPAVPEAAWKYVLTPRYERRAGRSIGDNATRGLQLYRANMLTGTAPRMGTYAGPVQVIIPLEDPFISPQLVSGLKDRFPGVEIVAVDAGHWFPEDNSAEFARLLDRWISAHPR